MTNAIRVLGLLALVGCAYDEGLNSYDLSGVVRLPKEALQVTLVDDNGNEFVIDDARAIGPVYLGAFASVREGDFAYPHPEMGPVIDTEKPGDTYPYGGTSVGRFDWGCYQSLVCKVVTGRYESYDDLIDFMANVVQDPIIDPNGNEVTDGTVFQERCYDALYITSDEELAWLGREPDFVDKGDYLEAEVTIPHVAFTEGMALWGWVDMPSKTFDYATCTDSVGEKYQRYNEDYYVGTNYSDLMNFPSLYIDYGDWVVNNAPSLSSPDEDFVLELGYHNVD